MLTSVALVDLFKAFDSIDHDLLLRKLQCYGVGGKESKWFSNYLSERKQRVLINGCASAWSEVTRGVPQGSILGPLLFKIFINDLPSAVTSSTIMMYADDTTLYHSCVDVGDLQQALSADLQSLAAWLKSNTLKINVQKTQLLLLGRRSGAWELERVRISLNGTEIRHQDQVKYLGVMIDRQLTWKQHISCIRQRCFQINRLRRSLSWKLRKQLYLSLVLPHLDYCCVAWHECSVELQNSIERIQNYGMRLILNRPPRTPSDELRRALKWDTLFNRRRRCRLQLVHKCVNKYAPDYMMNRLCTNASLGRPCTRGHSKLYLNRPW